MLCCVVCEKPVNAKMLFAVDLLCSDSNTYTNKLFEQIGQFWQSDEVEGQGHVEVSDSQ